MQQASEPITAWEIVEAVLITFFLAGLLGAILSFFMARRETNTAPTISPKEQYSIDTGRRAVGEIRDMMKDPDTTKFKDVLASGKAQCVVGQVNGKNSYGAYDGYKSFVWKGGKVIMQAADPTDEVSASFSCLSDQQKFNDTAIIATP